MLHHARFLKLAVAVLLAFVLYSCGPIENGIDNNQVITKPYTLYVGDSSGALIHTNNGVDFRIVGEYVDGFPTRALATSGNNILFVKGHAFVSEDFGANFNPINLSPNPDLTRRQSMVLTVEDYQDRIYMASGETSGNGIMYSDDHGSRKSWRLENAFDPEITGTFYVTSFTQLSKGTVFAYDDMAKRLFYKTGKDEHWKEQFISTASLPAGPMFLSHFINALILIDPNGTNGVWYSVDDGANWAQFTGIPPQAGRILCAGTAFSQTFLVGTEFGGVFRLPLAGTEFVPANLGLENGAIVTGIATKDDYYKNGKIAQYVYLATSKGLFKSQDLGENWILVLPGNFVSIY